MLAAVSVLAADGGNPSALWQVLGPIIVALVAIPPAVYTARATYRAAHSTNTVAQARNEQDRDAAMDARADATVASLWQRVDALDARLRAALDERDHLAERYARLRLFVIGLGFDPDALPPPAPSSGAPATP